MKQLSFIIGLLVMGTLVWLKISENKHRNFEYMQHQGIDEDVWLGN